MSLSPMQLLIILGIALLIFGTSKLKNAGKDLGGAVKGFKDAVKDEEEAIQAGIEDQLYSNALCLVEWPDKAAGLLPDDTLHIALEVLNEGTRRIYSLQEGPETLH